MAKEKAVAAKIDAIDTVSIGLDTPLETLMATFRNFAEGVERQLEAEGASNTEGLAIARAESAEALDAVIATEAPKRDQLVSLLEAIEERAGRIRKTVRNAEAIARHYESFVRGMESSILIYMQDRGLAEINGDFHRFKVNKLPDALEIDANQIPMEYRKFGVEYHLAEALKSARASLITMLTSSASEFQNRPEAYPVIDVIDKALKRVPAEAYLGQPDTDKIKAAIEAKKEVSGAALVTSRKRLDVK